MSTTLTLIQRIERSVFERIRIGIVDAGYLPDVLNYDLTNQTDRNQYKVDQAAIVANLGFSIDIYSRSGFKSKGIKKIPRIVIEWKRYVSGDIGADIAPFYVPANGDPLSPDSYLKKVMPHIASSSQFQIRIITNEAIQERVIIDILSNTLGRRGSIPFYDESTDFIFIRQTGYMENPEPAENTDEKIYMYEIPDIFEIDATILATGIVPITEINTEIQLKDINDNVKDTINLNPIE